MTAGYQSMKIRRVRLAMARRPVYINPAMVTPRP